jgi:hypothetical protein
VPRGREFGVPSQGFFYRRQGVFDTRGNLSQPRCAAWAKAAEASMVLTASTRRAANLNAPAVFAILRAVQSPSLPRRRSAVQCGLPSRRDAARVMGPQTATGAFRSGRGVPDCGPRIAIDCGPPSGLRAATRGEAELFTASAEASGGRSLKPCFTNSSKSRGLQGAADGHRILIVTIFDRYQRRPHWLPDGQIPSSQATSHLFS